MEKLPAEFTENGIHYTLHGDYYVPDLTCLWDDRPIGKWGRMDMAYLKEHKPGLYSQIVLSGKLNGYLADLNEQAQALLNLVVRQMAAAEDVNEKLKAEGCRSDGMGSEDELDPVSSGKNHSL